MKAKQYRPRSMLKSGMTDIFKSGSVRGVEALSQAAYCDTLQSKERRYGEYKECQNVRTILRLLDHEFIENYWLYTAHHKKRFGTPSQKI